MTENALRYVNAVTHLCGCVTRFDTLFWRSQVTKPCVEHARLAAWDTQEPK